MAEEEHDRVKFHDITNSMDMSLNKFREIVKDRKVSCATVHWVPKSRTQLTD